MVYVKHIGMAPGVLAAAKAGRQLAMAGTGTEWDSVQEGPGFAMGGRDT